MNKSSPTRNLVRRGPKAVKEWGRRWVKTAQKALARHRKTQAKTGRV